MTNEEKNIREIEEAINKVLHAANIKVSSLTHIAIEKMAKETALLTAVANKQGDDLCWITDVNAAKALPEAEFLESCRRYRQQIAKERGEFTGGKTIAQLETDLAAAQLEIKRLGADAAYCLNAQIANDNETFITVLRSEINTLREQYETAKAMILESASKITELSEREIRHLDLIRHCRHKLHDDDLITNEELAILINEKPGHSAVSRLEGYDKVKTELAAALEREKRLRDALECIIELRQHNGGPCDKRCEGCSECVATKALANEKRRSG